MRALPAFLCLALLGTTACGGASGGAEQDRTLTVLAAASLTETFTELGQRFEADHPGVDVRLAFDSSATLAAQVVEGAPADVLATADATTMQSVTLSWSRRTAPSPRTASLIRNALSSTG